LPDYPFRFQQREAIVGFKALVKAVGNQTRAAVGITRDTLRYKMKKFSLH